MTQNYTENVKIDGQQDAIQLDVEANGNQNEALQQWSENGGEPLARMTGDGRFQAGSFANGVMATDDSLIEAHREAGSGKPNRGLHLLGAFTDTLNTVISWVVQELVLKGSSGISALHSALRVKVTNENTGTMSAGAELRAGDFEVINDGGTVSNAADTRAVGVHAAVTNNENRYLETAIGIRSEITNASNGALDAAIGVDVELADNGTLTNAYGIRVADVDQGSGDNYAIKTGKGIAHFGDHIELPILSSDPTGDPNTDDLKLYPKLNGGVPNLYAKDDAGDVHLLTAYPKRAVVMADEFIPASGVTWTRYVDATQPYNFACYQTPRANGDEISVSVFLDVGTYDFHVLGVKSNNLGKIDWYLEDSTGTPFISGQDWGANPPLANQVLSGSVTLSTPGYHTIVGKINGYGSYASDYYFYFTKVWLELA